MTTNANERFTLLPRSVRPSHYTLSLTPDLESATFSGDVSIDILISEITSEVVLNAIELELGSAVFTPRGGDASTSTGITYNEDEETATISFAEPLPVGAGTLAISFTGILNDQLHGFYLSTFRDTDGVERRMAATQFEASDARRCFPCWDEPAIKATFQVDLIIPGGILSHLKHAGERAGAGGRWPGARQLPRNAHHVHVSAGIHRRRDGVHRSAVGERYAASRVGHRGTGGAGAIRPRNVSSDP